ncbi:MAG: hypothetical protein J5562_03125 [Clostridia bacterium]|nr:hypothetical protein [Clostridia bacterium]
MTASDAANKWNISQMCIENLCKENRIAGVAMLGNMYIIPADAEKPVDERIKRQNQKSGETNLYQVTIEETVSDTFKVYASNLNEAKNKAIASYNREEIILEPGELLEKRISVYDVEKDAYTEFEEF